MTAGPGAGRTPTLDGLRGIAVLAVVVEHAWPNLLPGGFAGVDVFFVLSGYLITGLLLREASRTGTVDLIAFYARRVRRIIPAATVCVIVVAILFTVVLGVGFGPSFRTEALSAALSVSNFLFVSRATDYFAADPSSSPFLHYWSLAVEEQFYLLWPTVVIVLFGVGRWAGRRGEPSGPSRATGGPAARWPPIALAAGIAGISFGLTLVSSQTTAFFLLPHRAWELLVGGLLAWLPFATPWSPRRGASALRWALAVGGAAALALTFLLHFERWPGLATTLPVLGTAALILGGTAMPGARWLSVTWLRFFGRISYALYLWHWPILAAAALIALPAAQPPLWMTVLAVVLAIGAAIASTFLLEEPIRFTPARWLTRVRALAAAGAFVALASVAVVVTTSAPPAEAAVPLGTQVPPVAGSPAPGATGLPVASTPPDIRPQLPGIPDDHERIIDDHCSTTTQDSEVRRCVYGAAANADGSPRKEVPAGMPVAVLWGDSHAMHWFTAVNAWATQAGVALVPLTRSGCPAVDADVAGEPEAIQSCSDWRRDAFARMADLDSVITIVASSSGVPVTLDGARVIPRFTPAPWITPTARFLDRLETLSRTVVYIADVPRPGFVVPDCLAAHWRDLATCALPVAEAQPAAFLDAEVAMAKAAGVTLIDPTPWICPDGSCTWLLGGRIAYRDDHHLTAAASLMLARQLSPLLDAAVAAAPAAPAAGGGAMTDGTDRTAGGREQVKLVVWDLDETVWRGVLAEGPVEVFPGRAELLRGLVDRGVMVSVSSRNDLAAARGELERLGLWELVIFPRINWEAKGAQVRDLIEAAQLRPPNVLFVDDNHLNREEAAFFAPGLQVADPADPDFDDLLAAVMASGRPDPDRRRLAEYRLLETRTTAAEAFGDNREFLRSCDIEVRLTDRPIDDADRLAELVARTNQLNYTKRRIDREAVGAMLRDPNVRSVAIRVTDRFGDYGLVGFAAVAGERVEQLAFSCRILGMGVERAVYEWLGKPAIDVAEPVSAPLDGESPDWLRIVEPGSADPSARAPEKASSGPVSARPRILFVGGCDLESVLPFLPDPDGAARHFNYSPPELPRLIVHRDSIDYLLADELPESTRKAILADAPFLDARALEPPDWAGVPEVVYSPLIDYVQAKFARADLPGLYVSFGDVQQPNLDDKRVAFLAERYGLDPRRLAAFAERWRVVQKPDDVWRDQLRRLFGRIRADAHLTVLLGATDAFGLDAERIETHRHHNALVAGVAAEFPNVSTLAVDPLLHGREDFTDSIRHYSRRVYHDIAGELSSRLNGAAASERRVSAARRLLRRGLRRLRGAKSPSARA